MLLLNLIMLKSGKNLKNSENTAEKIHTMELAAMRKRNLDIFRIGLKPEPPS